MKVEAAMEAKLYDIWMPFSMGHGRVQYFNPSTNEVVSKLPPGASPATEHVAALSVNGTLESSSGHPVRSLSFTQQSGSQPYIGTDAQKKMDEACMPKCSWDCGTPHCNAVCKPKCAEPVCQTRCPKPDYKSCEVQCNESPRCHVLCKAGELCNELGKNGFPTDGSEKCSNPKCDVNCGKDPTCFLKCPSNPIHCHNVCAPPKCEWDCTQPEVCSKPDCKVTCSAKKCSDSTKYELPALEKSDFPVKQFMASNGPAHAADSASWVVGEWGSCTSSCTQSRPCGCPSGSCAGQPQCSRPCPCQQNKQTDLRSCSVTLYGGPHFDGWRVDLDKGKYSAEDLEKSGVQCQDISSLEVHGTCCKTIVYDYGDFGQGAPGSGKGWRVELEHGRYDRDALENRGVHNNDISAVEVEIDEMCVQTGGKGTWMAAPPPLVATNPGDGWGFSSSSSGSGQFESGQGGGGPTRDGYSSEHRRSESYDDQDRRDDMYGDYGQGANQGNDDVTADWFRNDRHHGHGHHKRSRHHHTDEDHGHAAGTSCVVLFLSVAVLRW